MSKAMVIYMKFYTPIHCIPHSRSHPHTVSPPRAGIWIVLLLVFGLLLTSCGVQAQEKAAKDILDRVIACDQTQMKEIMGGDITALSDMEMFTMRRLTYQIVGVRSKDNTHCAVTVDVTGFDLMSLFNEALISVYADSTFSDKNAASAITAWALDKLNSDTAEKGTFRAVLPLVLTDEGNTWVLDTEQITDDLRDAVTGGAYSWFQAYTEVFGETAETEDSHADT